MQVNSTMSYYLTLVLLFIMKLEPNTQMGIIHQKFIYQQTMSEQCRRGVAASVFLGRKVLDAYSQTLSLTSLDLPYSCLINVRTEPGSNIIAVLDTSQECLTKTCAKSQFKDQLVMYEMGETFGGYWGAIPDDMLQQNGEKPSKLHTLKTTPPTTRKKSSTSSVITEEEEETETSTTVKPAKDGEGRDYMIYEVPLVNVSMRLVPGQLPSDVLFDRDELFDIHYDVTPRMGIDYATKIMPLLQVSRLENSEGRKYYDVGIYTPDPRLTLPQLSSTKSIKRKYNINVNRRLDFAKSKALFSVRSKTLTVPSTSSSHIPKFTKKPPTVITRKFGFSQSTSEPTYSWEAVDDLLKSLRESQLQQTDDNGYGRHLSDLLHGLSGKKTSKIAIPSKPYRKPGTTQHTFSSSYKTDSITPFPAIYKSNYYLRDSESTEEIKAYTRSSGHETKETSPFRIVINDDFTLSTTGLLPPILDVDVAVRNQTPANMTIGKQLPLTTQVRPTTSNRSKPLLGSLVGHESWENIVQSAPVLIKVLNKTAPKAKRRQGKSSNKTRSKRYIHGIPIENARPHHLVAKHSDLESLTTTDDDNIEHFLHSFELEDDGIVDRISLRHPDQYVGAPVFNICEIHHSSRHIYIFNTSRLIIAITNFTLSTMTIVLTPAYTLKSKDGVCSSAELECQISGTRACIDLLNACDGVPNCGSFDIYDEDHLSCGGSGTVAHNVYLTAFVLIAVMLVLLYITFYWLRRCVPKVPNAFFVHAESTENTLNLKPIMRSPTDDYGEHGGSGIYDYDVDFDGGFKWMDVSEKRTVAKLLVRCLGFLLCQRRHKNYISAVISDASKSDIFRDFNISTCMADAVVQTGSSLEMKQTVGQKLSNINLVTNEPKLDSGTDLDIHLDRYSSDELSMLLLFKQSRTQNMKEKTKERTIENTTAFEYCDISIKHPSLESAEILINHLEYGSLPDMDDSLEKPEISMIPSEPSKDFPGHKNVRKHLRFERAVVINSSSDEEGKDLSHRNVRLGARATDTDRDLMEEDPHHTGNIPKESKIFFWNKNKNKKSKKKPKP